MPVIPGGFAVDGASTLTGLIEGLKIAPNSSNPTYQIDIATGRCRDDGDADIMLVSSPITVDMTVIGAANGLDVGPEGSKTPMGGKINILYKDFLKLQNMEICVDNYIYLSYNYM